MSDEQIELGSSAKFWNWMRKQRKGKTIPVNEFKKKLTKIPAPPKSQLHKLANLETSSNGRHS